jgi:hypothetical protein
LSHIFGVDIDPQAVEVTKLSLLLKVLEGETDESLVQQLRILQERALPDLGENIKCGNSLVPPDGLPAQGSLLPDDILEVINPFDWSKEFPSAYKSGGFEVVLGNPPWLMAGYYVNKAMDYLRSQYQTATGKFDLYYVFLEKACSLVRAGGRVGMIVPNKLFHTRAATQLRTLLSRGEWLESVIDFGDQQVFAGPTNYSCIVTLAKHSHGSVHYSRATPNLGLLRKFDMQRERLEPRGWNFADADSLALWDKMQILGSPLEGLVSRFGTGVQTGADPIMLLTDEEVRDLGLEKEGLRRLLRGRDVRRYLVSANPQWVIFPYNDESGEFRILSRSELQQLPNLWN